MNTSQRTGKVIADPVHTNSPHERLAFSIGVDDSIDMVPRTNVFHCVLIGPYARLMERYLSKDTFVIATGRDQSYALPEGGHRYEMIVDHIEPLTTPPVDIFSELS